MRPSSLSWSSLSNHRGRGIDPMPKKPQAGEEGEAVLLWGQWQDPVHRRVGSPGIGGVGAFWVVTLSSQAFLSAIDPLITKK